MAKHNPARRAKECVAPGVSPGIAFFFYLPPRDRGRVPHSSTVIDGFHCEQPQCGCPTLSRFWKGWEYANWTLPNRRMAPLTGNGPAEALLAAPLGCKPPPSPEWRNTTQPEGRKNV